MKEARQLLFDCTTHFTEAQLQALEKRVHENRSILKITNTVGFSGLEMRVVCNDVNAIRRMAAMGWSINYGPSLAKRTALHVAVTSKHAESVAVLLELGANPNLPDFMGMIPLYDAIKWADYASLALLLRVTDDLDSRLKDAQSQIEAALDLHLDDVKATILNMIETTRRERALDQVALPTSSPGRPKVRL
jgi:ankyrin repeat protein